MWSRIVKQLGQFPTAVLTGLDADRFPTSLRCSPTPDHERRVLRITLPPSAAVRPGPASIVCHSHDEQLWKLKSFLIRGRLDRDTEGWLFIPSKFVPGVGMAGPWSLLKSMLQCRRVTKRYLTRRNEPRPKIPWAQLRALRREAEYEPLEARISRCD